MTPSGFTPAQQSAWRLSLSLTALRALLAPVLVVLAANHAPGWSLATAVTVAFLSDVFDGVVARRGNAVTAALRRADSMTDIVFYVTVAGTTWLWYRPVVAPWAVGIGLVIAGEALSNGIALLKFRRDASYHAWTARIWGLIMFVAVVVVFGFGSSLLLPVAIAAAFVAQAEAIAITLVLPSWQTDVGSLRNAFRLRAQRARQRQEL